MPNLVFLKAFYIMLLFYVFNKFALIMLQHYINFEKGKPFKELVIIELEESIMEFVKYSCSNFMKYYLSSYPKQVIKHTLRLYTIL